MSRIGVLFHEDQSVNCARGICNNGACVAKMIQRILQE